MSTPSRSFAHRLGELFSAHQLTQSIGRFVVNHGTILKIVLLIVAAPFLFRFARNVSAAFMPGEGESVVVILLLVAIVTILRNRPAKDDKTP